MLNATASTVTGNTTLGAAVFNYSIPPGSDAAYDTSAVVVIQVGAVKSQAHLFSPTNPNWVQDNIRVGNSTLSVNFTYTPPVAGGQLGNLTLNSGTMSLSGQSPQPMTSSSLVNWDTSGNVY